MRPEGVGRSDLLLNVGPPNVAARLSFGDLGDRGAGTGVSNVDKLRTFSGSSWLLTCGRACDTDVVC